MKDVAQITRVTPTQRQEVRLTTLTITNPILISCSASSQKVYPEREQLRLGERQTHQLELQARGRTPGLRETDARQWTEWMMMMLLTATCRL